MPDYELVEQPDSIAPDLGRHEYVGIDTEFMREKTFFAELCLVQIATGSRIYCVDPLPGNPMGAFWDTLMRDIWVLHSGRPSLRAIPGPVSQMIARRVSLPDIRASGSGP